MMSVPAFNFERPKCASVENQNQVIQKQVDFVVSPMLTLLFKKVLFHYKQKDQFTSIRFLCNRPTQSSS